MPVLITMLVLLVSGSSAAAGELVLSSGNQGNTLIELYTSEGCSSCPPMERYVNRFSTHEKLWENYIPVVFHVDYWDYIGWDDRYASPAFSRRQRQHAGEGNVRTVYTPALIVNGKGWRPRLFDHYPEPETGAHGKLEVSVSDGMITADFTPLADNTAKFTLHIALLAMGLESHITAGENKGRTAQHDFVVVGLKSPDEQGRHWQTRLPVPHYSDTRPRGLAVWVTRAGSLKPLQAVGGYLE